MAASSVWRKSLNDHKIFQVLRRNNEKSRVASGCRNCIAIQDGELFVWDSYSAHLLTVNLKNLLPAKRKERDAICQTLLCTWPPIEEVENIVFSRTGYHVALVGQRSICVMELPRRWGKYAEYEGGKERISCKTLPVGERVFSSNRRLRLLQASWHPGSFTDTHLVLLTSDNCIRIFDITDPQTPEQTIPLDETDVSCSLSTTRTTVGAALGESAVAFDFGPPEELKLKNKKATDTPCTAWPIYLLKGGGDVFITLTCVDKNRKNLKPCVRGPLHMYPPAEDNYGTDACAILCLMCQPPVIVVATCEGKLHHCVLLNKDNDEDCDSESLNGLDVSHLYEPIPEPSLYVYESVELELSLTTVAIETDEVVPDDFSCPIKLHKDPASHDRYHCSHDAGVHSLILPWIHNFQTFCREEESSILAQYEEEDQAVVEHLVCTKPLQSSQPSPVLGVSVTADHLLGTHLLCLTSTLECVSLPLRSTITGAPPPLVSTSPTKRVTSPLRRLHKEPFDQHIRRILQRSASNPIIKSGDKSTMSQQECFQLLSRATQVFREEYVQKLDLAREEIQRRVRILKDQKEQQMADIEECRQSRNILTENARALAEKFEDAKERQQAVAERIETILQKIQFRLPVLSDAEKNIQKELKSMEDRVVDFKSSLQQLKVKQEYQKHQVSSQKYSSSSSPAINRNQMSQVKSVLKQEGDEVAGMVKKVNQLKIQLNI